VFSDSGCVLLDFRVGVCNRIPRPSEQGTPQKKAAYSTEWIARRASALEATQGQMDGFFSQLSYKCHLEEVASVGD